MCKTGFGLAAVSTLALAFGACSSSSPMTPPQDAAPMDQVVFERPPPDAPLNEAGTYCTDFNGPGTIHDKDISASETWLASDSPHIVMKTLVVGGDSASATLTIDGCAVVKFADGAGLDVNPAGKRGALTILPPDHYHPATLTSMNDKHGAWKGLYFGPGDGKNDDASSSRLNHVTIANAGGPSGRAADAAVFLEGSGKAQMFKPSPHVPVDDITITGSAKYAIYSTRAAYVDSAGGSAILKDNDYRPVHIEPEYVGRLPTGDFSGNKEQGVEVQGSDGTCVCTDLGASNCAEGLCIRTSTNWANHQTPYVIKGIVHIGLSGSTTATAVITLPGAIKVLMAPDSGILVGVDDKQQGGLRLQGSDNNGLTIGPETAGSGPGSWYGIMFGAYADWTGNGSRFMYVTIDGAGKAWPQTKDRTLLPKSCGSASIDATRGAIVFNHYDPNNLFLVDFDPNKFQYITHTKITNSAGHGIVRAWNHPTADATMPDFTSADKMNDLKGVGVAGCAQTNPQTAGTCAPCTP